MTIKTKIEREIEILKKGKVVKTIPWEVFVKTLAEKVSYKGKLTPEHTQIVCRNLINEKGFVADGEPFGFKNMEFRSK